MIEHLLDTGDTGRLKIEDNTDTPGLMTVEFFVRSFSPIAIPQLPWARSINTSRNSWQSFNFQNTTLWQRLGGVFVGTAETFTLHLGVSGTSQLGGPTDFQINLAGYVPPQGGINTVSIRVGTRYRKATPYVRDNGTWKIAKPYVRVERGWQEIK